MKVPLQYQILLLAMTTFVAGANEYILAGILDLVAPGLGAPVALAGQLITLYAFVYGLCVPIVVALTSHIGRRKVMITAMLLYALASIATLLVQDFWTFVPVRILQALSGGTAVVTALSTAASLAGSQRQGRAIATVIMGFTASLIVAVPVGREIALRFGWHAVFPLVGLLSLVVALSHRFVLPALSPAASIPLRAQLAFLHRPAVLAGLMVTVLWMAGYVMTYSFLTPYLIGVQHLDGASISPLLLAFGLASLVGSRFGGSRTDRHGYHATLVASKLLQAACLLTLPLAAWLWPSGSLYGVAAALIMWSATAWAAGPAQQIRAAALVPEARGVLVGLNQSGMQLGIALGTALGGMATQSISLAGLPWLSAVLVLGSLVLMGFCRRLAGPVAALQ
ncbi:MFS transporter [Castellaniella daejeonensis]|jgi:DHA1 family putative efflux transporter-like MFS transporter|uniref:MFS transporter n=1 Tax=Castellaniella daejeonensis TaxID=659013 RepID=A0ABN0TMS3_9BURK